MFVLSAALDRTGVIDGIGRLMIRSADASPALALLSLMLGVMLLSAFINNTPVVVILTPVAIAFAQASGTAPSKLLIPLSYASILEIGRASCRESVCQYVSISVGAVSLKKKN